MLCEYGCGQEAKNQLPNGKWCCCKSYKKCPEIIRKNKEGQQKSKQLKKCPYCHCLITNNMGNQYILHINKCKKEYEKKQLLESKNISKYVKWYNNIIKYRQEHPLLEGYKEKHHILPRSLGGSNDNSNLIYLTAREHYICHMLLVEIYSKDRKSYRKMLAAFMMMKTRENDNFKINSRLYEYYRIEYSKLKKNTGCGEKNNQYGKIWISNEELKITKTINKEELEKYLNKGWFKGRVSNWDYYFAKKIGLKMNGKFYKRQKDSSCESFKDFVLKELERKKEYIKKYEENYNNNVRKYLEYYEVYKKYGLKGVYEKTDYNNSRQNLIQQFRRYLKDDFKIYKRKKK